MQLSKLMTYLQRILWQSKRQIADVHLPCSQVRFGSQAAIQGYLSSTAAFGTNPAVHEADFQTSILSGCFTQKRSFRSSETRIYDRQLTAKSGHSIDPKSNSATRSKRPIADIVVVAPEHCLPKTGCIPEPFIYAVFEPLATHF